MGQAFNCLNTKCSYKGYYKINRKRDNFGITYWPNGQIRFINLRKNDLFEDSKCFSSNGERFHPNKKTGHKSSKIQNLL